MLYLTSLNILCENLREKKSLIINRDISFFLYIVESKAINLAINVAVERHRMGLKCVFVSLMFLV